MERDEELLPDRTYEWIVAHHHNKSRDDAEYDKTHMSSGKPKPKEEVAKSETKSKSKKEAEKPKPKPIRLSTKDKKRVKMENM